MLSTKLATNTNHIADGYILPPWEALEYINSNATLLFKEFELRDLLQQRMRNVPWQKHRKLMKDVEAMLRNVSDREIAR